MLESLELENFQCYRKFQIDLNHPIVCLLGPSDSGKSAILRAIKWIAHNRPSGDSFINYDADYCKGTLKVDGSTIIRERSKSVNSYELDGIQFKAFGADVPSPISHLLNLGEINWSSQLSQPLWFLQTPGEVSKELNSIINLGLIDQTMANIATELRRVKSVAAITQERFQDAQTQMDLLSWVPIVSDRLKALEDLSAEVEQKRSKAESIASILSGIQDYETTAKDATEAVLEGSIVVALADDVIKQQNKQKKLVILLKDLESNQRIADAAVPTEVVTKLDNLKESIVKGIKQKQALKVLLFNLAEMEQDASITIPNDKIEQIDNLKTTIDQTFKKRNALKYLLQTIADEEERSCREQKTLQLASEELKKEMSGLCPICGKEM